MDASLYDELHRVEQIHWWFRARRQIVWSLVRRFVEGGIERRLKVCELGCGTGGNLAAIVNDHDVVGIECSPDALEYARRALAGRVHYGRLPDNVDLPPNAFDVVLMTDVLEHIEDDMTSARTALELLRPGGIVVATVPAYQWLFSPRDVHHHHFRRYRKNQFGALWNLSNARIELLSHYNSALFPAAVAVRLASKFFRRRVEPGDLSVPVPTINRLLERLMGSEVNLVGRVPIPFGLSLIAIARKVRPMTERTLQTA